MSTHYRIATENARLGQPEIKLGIVPGYGGLQRLPRLVGPRLAAELSVNGEAIDARTALNAGLVDEFAVSSRALDDRLDVRDGACRTAGMRRRRPLHNKLSQHQRLA